MGYNTSVIVLNDALETIAEDPYFGKRLRDAVHSVGVNDGKPIDIPAVSPQGAIHCNAATVIETHHADCTSVVTIGGNCGQVLGITYGWRNDLSKEEDKIRILKALAYDLGYTIRKSSRVPRRKI